MWREQTWMEQTGAKAGTALNLQRNNSLGNSGLGGGGRGSGPPALRAELWVLSRGKATLSWLPWDGQLCTCSPGRINQQRLHSLSEWALLASHLDTLCTESEESGRCWPGSTASGRFSP